MTSLPANFFDTDADAAVAVEYMDDEEEDFDDEELDESDATTPAALLMRNAASLPQNLPPDFFDRDGGSVPTEYVQ
jgi:hypothetical protein